MISSNLIAGSYLYAADTLIYIDSPDAYLENQTHTFNALVCFFLPLDFLRTNKEPLRQISQKGILISAALKSVPPTVYHLQLPGTANHPVAHTKTERVA